MTRRTESDHASLKSLRHVEKLHAAFAQQKSDRKTGGGVEKSAINGGQYGSLGFQRKMAGDFLNRTRRGALVLVEWNRHQLQVSRSQARGDKFEGDVPLFLDHETTHSSGSEAGLPKSRDLAPGLVDEKHGD